MPLARTRTQCLLPGAVLLAALLAIAACRRGQPVPEGNIAATLTVPTTTSPAFDPATLKGKPTLVVFAWPTCGHCAKEIPTAQKVADSENASLVVVFTQGGQKHAATAAKQFGVTGPVLVDDGTLKKKYEVRAVPYTLVLDGEGEAVRAYLGEQDEDTLRSAVAAAR
jgi:thiol-disulfide isomerase/thioredoxin